MLLVGNGKLITWSGTNPYLENGAVALDGDTAWEAGPLEAMRAKYPQAEFVDARGGVIMPGLINAHTHIYSALARGLSINGYAPTNFYEVLDGQWWYIDRHLDLAATKASAQALVIDSIKQGVTTIFDHHASFCEIPGSLMEIAKVTESMGMRACLCYEVSDRDGEEKSLQSVQENKDFIDYCESHPSDMLKAMFGGHALFTISDRTFDRMNAANAGRVGYHIHVSEGMNDVYDSLQNYGRRPVQRLQDHGILGPKTILGHCIHVNTDSLIAQLCSHLIGRSINSEKICLLIIKCNLFKRPPDNMRQIQFHAQFKNADLSVECHLQPFRILLPLLLISVLHIILLTQDIVVSQWLFASGTSGYLEGIQPHSVQNRLLHQIRKFPCGIQFTAALFAALQHFMIATRFNEPVSVKCGLFDILINTGRDHKVIFVLDHLI